MEGVKGRPRRGTAVYGEFGGHKTAVEERIEERKRLALRNKVKEEKHLEIYGGLKGDIGMKACLHGPKDYAKKLKLRFHVGDLDLYQKEEINSLYQ